LIKPYSSDELKALLLLAKYKIIDHDSSKPTSDRNETVTLGEGYCFDEKKEKLYFNDIHINLGTKELKLLKLLIYHRGFIVEFETIENELWNDNTISTSAVRTLIYRLRGKMEYKFIETVYNQGLKLDI